MRAATFDGATYDAAQDETRLLTQLECVRLVMADQQWRTFDEIRAAMEARYDKHASEASVSARLRDLRKDRFGAYQVEHRRRREGLWEYRVLPPLPVGQMGLL